ncbi:MAG: hypothetical protein ACLT4M_00095 [Faecalibacterium sp.]|jgi:hypothetical protein
MIYLHFFAAEPCAPHDKLVFCPPFCLQADPARNFPGVLSSLVRSYHGVTFPEVIPLAAGHSIFKVQCLLTRTILPKKTAFSRICKRLEKSEKPPYFHAFGNVL